MGCKTACDIFDHARLELCLISSSKIITPTVKIISSLLNGLISYRELGRVEVVISEVLRNALEHGNLGISYEEKTAALENDAFEQLLSERSSRAIAHGLKIRVIVDISPTEFCCVVEDDGEGFNWQDVPEPIVDPTVLLKLHGRGLAMVNKEFDQVLFNDKGNSVKLLKKLA
ncbi:MAG: ATP-binding protein [Deltaproteobacteria bacterium]|nr:ATP-binding protein [Deltaproteobacteria bacterium]